MNLTDQKSWRSLAVIGMLSVAAHAQTLTGSSLSHALQRGGNVIVMRHASSPQTPPSPEDIAAGNAKGERQLDQTGIDSARQMGASLRKLSIPIGTVYSSPAFRAVQTVRYAELGVPTIVSELGDHGVSMTGVDGAQTAWLQDAVKHVQPGKNIVIVTHMPNIMAAFPDQAAGLKDGEALIFGPGDGNSGTRLLARIKMNEWWTLPQ